MTTILPVTAYQIEWRTNETRPSYHAGVIWMSYRYDSQAGSGQIPVNTAADLAAYAAVLSSGRPVFHKLNTDALSTDPSFQTSQDTTASGDDFLILWSQLTWAQTTGGVILLHLDDKPRTSAHDDNFSAAPRRLAVSKTDPAEFAAIAAALKDPSPAYLRKRPLSIVRPRESSFIVAT